MANKSLFSSIKSWLPRAEATNEAGGPAYQLAPKHALAQLTATGCFDGAYYATAENQLDALKRLIDLVDDNDYLTMLAVHAARRGPHEGYAGGNRDCARSATRRSCTACSNELSITVASCAPCFR